MAVIRRRVARRYNVMNSFRTLIFTHIPKTAGTTLHFILERQYGGVKSYTEPDINANRFSSMPAKKRAEMKLIKGHILFGVHKYCHQPVSYIAMFRKPQDRVISDYNFLCNLHRTNFLLKNRKKATLTLKEYLKNGIVLYMDNCQVRYLCGVDNIPYGGVTEAHLKMAMDNLHKHYKAVGLTERFDESILFFAETFGWRTPFYNKKNVTPLKGLEQLDEETEELLKYYNRYDEILYQAAREIFEGQIKKSGTEFKAKLLAFEEENKRRFLNNAIASFFVYFSLFTNIYTMRNLAAFVVMLAKDRAWPIYQQLVRMVKRR